MNDMIFALVTPQVSHNKQTVQKLREITIAWSRYGYHGAFIEGNHIDDVLKKAASTNYAYCLIQTAGHVIDEQWYLPHWQKKGFYQSLKDLMNDTEFLVSGQCYHNDNVGTGLKKDCLLVNLEKYKMLGQPAFGNADDNNHDDQAMIKAQQKESFMANCDGWNFIQQSLEYNLPIKHFTEDFNRCRFDLSEQADCNQFVQLIGSIVNDVEIMNQLTNDQRDFFNNIKKQLRHAQNGIFLLNIEPYDDLIKQQEKQPSSPNLDALFSVAAGFKPYRILYTQGFKDNTSVVFFDYSQKALDIKKYMIENWDGKNFVGLVKKLFTRYPQGEVFYQLWFETTPDNIDWYDMEQLWQNELSKWGGEEAFSQHWQQCKKLPHQYVHCDLLKDRNALLDLIKAHSHSYIWWSNAFFTIYSHWFYSAAERKKQYLHWIEDLSRAAPECMINGADQNNIAVNGLNASQYYEQFNQKFNDELIPQALHHTDIQF